MSDSSNTVFVGKNLKQARATIGWSLSKAQQQTGVSKAMLGQIERGESSPTIATLWKIAKGFHLPLTSFIEDNTDTTDYFQPAQVKAVKFQDSIGFRTIFPYDPVYGTETFLMTLRAKETHTSAPHDKGVVEDIIVTSGTIEIMLDGDWKIYNTGDALRFKADRPHGYRNMTTKPASFHNIIHYPSRT